MIQVCAFFQWTLFHLHKQKQKMWQITLHTSRNNTSRKTLLANESWFLWQFPLLFKRVKNKQTSNTFLILVLPKTFLAKHYIKEKLIVMIVWGLAKTIKLVNCKSWNWKRLALFWCQNHLGIAVVCVLDKLTSQ